MKFLLIVLLFVICLAPLPFGLVHMWAWSAVAILCAVLMLVWGIIASLKREPVIAPWHLVPSFLGYSVVLAWIFLQSSSGVPKDLFHPFWELSRSTGPVVVGSISLNPTQSLSQLARLLTYALVFWLMLQWTRDRKRCLFAIEVLSIASIIYGAYGIYIYASGENKILWFDKTSYFDVVSSTFVNRNSFGTYAGIGLILISCGLVNAIEERVAANASRTNRFIDVFVLLFGRFWHFVVGWFIVASALLLTGSRAAIFSSILGLFAYAFALGLRRKRDGFVSIRRLVLFLGFAILVVVTISGELLIDRLASVDVKKDFREDIYTGTLRAIGDQPWLGVGAGAFQDAFRVYRSADLTKTVAKAHNTYLEHALELGIPAALVLLISIGWLGAVCLVGAIRRTRTSAVPCMGFACTVLVATHSMVDFSLQVPAIALTFAAVLGIAYAQSWSIRVQS